MDKQKSKEAISSYIRDKFGKYFYLQYALTGAMCSIFVFIGENALNRRTHIALDLMLLEFGIFSMYVIFIILETSKIIIKEYWDTKKVEILTNRMKENQDT
jgi:hypothetical protein